MRALILATILSSSIDDARAYLLLGDPRSALQVIDKELQKNPSDALVRAKVEALAQMQDKEKLLGYFASLPDESRKDEKLLDHLAWGIVNVAAKSPSEHLRRMALVCSAMSRREKGVLIVERMLSDPSAQLRGMAASFCGMLRDERLARRLSKRLGLEKSGLVRPEMIRALGAMRARSALPALKELMTDSSVTEEEVALLRLSCEEIGDRAEKSLFTAKAPALRAHGATLAALEDRLEDFDAIAKLCKDAQREVRASALFALYTLAYDAEKKERLKKIALEGLEDVHADVQLIAAKVLMPYGEPKAAQKLLELSCSKRQHLARKAAGIFAASGERAAPFLKEAYAKSQDPLVRLNLSLGILLHNKDQGVAAEAIEEVLSRPHLKLARSDIGSAGSFYIERLGAFDFQAEEVDLMERLSLLDRLAHIDEKRARVHVPNLLKPRQWGSVFAVAGSLLKQQPDLALELIASHLNNPDWAIRTQAALILVHLGGDPKARRVLIEAFDDAKAPRSAKLAILEGMLQVDGRESIEFFTSLLAQPYEALQVAAAGCMICALDR